MPAFLPGLDPAQPFYELEVQPRLARVMHSAALLGPGSDVLGYDDVRSTDHYWGPRLQVFVDEPDVGREDRDRGAPCQASRLADRVAQEEAFVGRSAEAGDELGSQVLAARVGRDLRRLGFLPSWPPQSPPTPTPPPEDALVRAYEEVARRHNAAQISDPQEPTVRLSHDRPFRVINAGRLPQAREAIEDAPLRALPLVGAVDQWVDSTDVLSTPVGATVIALYGALG